jgi:hypothetical protein
MEMCAITVRKEGVQAHIRTDANKLHNCMIKLCILGKVAKYKNVRFVRDDRSVKVKSGNSTADYLQITLWFDRRVLNNAPSYWTRRVWLFNRAVNPDNHFDGSRIN